MSDSSEKVTSRHERGKSPEELERAGREHKERLRDQLEKTGEQSRNTVEDARHEVEQAQKSIEQDKVTRENDQVSPAERRKDGPISKSAREASYNATMKQVRSELSGPSRTFSKVIHNKVVEKVSDALGATVARPNAILSGAITAFTLTLAVYLTAKYYGYPLSGFESIGSFIVGWIFGILFDYFHIMITGKK